MSEHTPGPWLVEYVDDFWELYSVGDNWALADIHGTGDAKIDEANARLMAAGPDLLEACKMAQHLISLMDDYELPWGAYDTQEALDAAIAKATNEPG